MSEEFRGPANFGAINKQESIPKIKETGDALLEAINMIKANIVETSEKDYRGDEVKKNNDLEDLQNQLESLESRLNARENREASEE